MKIFPWRHLRAMSGGGKNDVSLRRISDALRKRGGQKQRGEMIINHKKTKIVATLGPASDDLRVMTDMVKAGVNVFRINMSHATPELAALRAERVRQINTRYGTNVAI